MTDINFEYRKLRGKIIEKYGTIGAFSKELGMTINIVSQKLNCKTKISQAEIIKWAELLDIDKSDIGIYFFT